ncbi:hypothetical protein QFC96_04140 [Latilactobacillus curvatus]|uniref:hypothetical protein n=1 Tax=Latilactobacillus curvatus TaxID=28038 RepID=UPI0024BB88B4|nr:hypothetical protein [Latilactobacillus curvatus]WHQ78959.1 hypothetical protein QFC96_04140 [Latilactobacillus curvatus]
MNEQALLDSAKTVEKQIKVDCKFNSIIFIQKIASQLRLAIRLIFKVLNSIVPILSQKSTEILVLR